MIVFGGFVVLLIVGVFVFIFVMIAKVIVESILEAQANRSSPLESRAVRLVAKRTNVSGGGGDTTASTTYYATFEDADGRREEFRIPGKDYGLLVEGDRGTLWRQGTWFKGFERTSMTRRTEA